MRSLLGHNQLHMCAASHAAQGIRRNTLYVCDTAWSL